MPVHVPEPPDYVLAPLVSSLLPVFPSGRGVCAVCRGPVNPGGWSRCWSCNTSRKQVQAATEHVIPISLTHKQGHQLYHVLKNYKHYASTNIREQFRNQLAALTARFLARHGNCLSGVLGGDWDFLTVVPSSTGRPPPHPLESVLGKSATLGGMTRQVLGPGAEPMGHNQASDKGYALLPGANVRGDRVVVIDDTFTSGSRAQSAASRLKLSGAASVVIVPIGRIVSINDPEHPEGNELYDRAQKTPFSFDVCCLCWP